MANVSIVLFGDKAVGLVKNRIIAAPCVSGGRFCDLQSPKEAWYGEPNLPNKVAKHRAHLLLNYFVLGKYTNARSSLSLCME